MPKCPYSSIILIIVLVIVVIGMPRIDHIQSVDVPLLQICLEQTGRKSTRFMPEMQKEVRLPYEHDNTGRRRGNF